MAPANGRTMFCCHSAIEAYARSDMIRGARADVSTVRAWKPKEARVVVCVCAIHVGSGWVFGKSIDAERGSVLRERTF